MTKYTHYAYNGFFKQTYIYKYEGSVCTHVYDSSKWVVVADQGRLRNEIDIPDTAVLLFAGGLPWPNFTT